MEGGISTKYTKYFCLILNEVLDKYYMEGNKLKEKVFKFYTIPDGIEKHVFDSFLKKHSKFFKDKIESEFGKGKDSNGKSIQFLFTNKKEILVRIKKITGKNIFGSLKTEWEDFIIDKENTITDEENLFSLTDNEKELFQKIKEIKSLIKIDYEKDFEKFINKGISPKSKINYYSYPEIDGELNIKNYSNHEIVTVKGKTKFYFSIDDTIDVDVLKDYLKTIIVFSCKKLGKKYSSDFIESGKYFFRVYDDGFYENSDIPFIEGKHKKFEIKYIQVYDKIGIRSLSFSFNLYYNPKKLCYVEPIPLLGKLGDFRHTDTEDWNKSTIKRFLEKFSNIFLNEFFLNYETLISNTSKKIIDIKETTKKKNSLIKELDKDSDGILDVVQTNVFHELLRKHEKSIIQIDRDYIKNFVKLSNYLKTIRNNLQNTFEILSKVEFSKDLESLTNILKNKIHTYNSLLLHSLSMIVSLTKDEMITFYEIYEMFDELKVYDSKHEKDMLSGIKSIKSELEEVNENLKEVGDKLDNKLEHISGQFYDLMNQMKESDERIINSIDNLTYTTTSSIESLSNNVQSELQSINSSIKFNNLLTGIQSYQMYKINLNTKSLRG